MISARIIDNDMGRVAKVALTGRGTVHGVTVKIDGVELPEFDVGLSEMLAADMSIPRFESHVAQHISEDTIAKSFVESYRQFVKPVNQSGKSRY